jgi:nitrite reductase/ring-hydroxylating ferredoxin subunit
MTAPTIERLPIRVPGRALADALLAEFEELFAAADACPHCDKPLPDAVFGYDTAIPPAAHWVNIDPTRFGKLTSHAHSLWTDYTTHQPVQELHNGWLRVACPSAAAAEHLRNLLLGYGLPAVAVWTGGAS